MKKYERKDMNKDERKEMNKEDKTYERKGDRKKENIQNFEKIKRLSARSVR